MICWLLFRQFAGPTEFGGGTAGVLHDFLDSGSDGVPGDGLVDALFVTFVKRVLYETVFAAMEADNADSAAGAKAIRRYTQKLLKACQFVIYENSQGLKRPCGRMERAETGFLLLFLPGPLGHALRV